MNLYSLLICVCLVVSLTAGAADEANMIVNGTFEKGSGTQADGWGQIDGRTATWSVVGGNPDGCLCLDTRTLPIDTKLFAEAADMPSLRNRALGENEGAWSVSQPVTVNAGDEYYRVEADVKGPERSAKLFSPEILVCGFRKFAKERDTKVTSFFQIPHPGGPAYSGRVGLERAAQAGDFISVYRHGVPCRTEKPGQWQHYQLTFRLFPSPEFRPDVLMIKLHALWPLGIYTFDNVVLRKATQAEIDKINRKGVGVRP